MSRGFSPGGIRDAQGFKAEANQFEADMAQGAADMGQRERLDRRFAGSTLSREPQPMTPMTDPPPPVARGTVNPNATQGAGYGTPISRTGEVGQFQPAPPAVTGALSRDQRWPKSWWDSTNR
jgi:hypothetical protein